MSAGAPPTRPRPLALSDNGVPVRFIAYPVNGHSPEDPVHRADIDRRYVEWFSKYLK